MGLIYLIFICRMYKLTLSDPSHCPTKSRSFRFCLKVFKSLRPCCTARTGSSMPWLSLMWWNVAWERVSERRLKVFENKSAEKEYVDQRESGRPPIFGCPRLLIQYIRRYARYWRPFLHPQPEDAPCRGDRDPLITELALIEVFYCLAGDTSWSFLQTVT